MSDVLYEANPSILRTHPFATVLLVVALLVGLAIAIFGGAFSDDVGLPAQFLGLLGIVIAAGAAVWLLAWYVSSKMDHLTIKNDEIVWSHGLIKKQYTEINMSSVRTVRVAQSLLQRIMNAGDVSIYTSGDQPELVVRGLPGPGAIREHVKGERPEQG